ncbi:IPT/TIG domain-containing protein [Catalinimonas alkaloidigena]|uniref:IPT/TIG domain-containing protein n=1 Tax=Catalinimonas alkaloidigena TaxID=1075417 RepID=A0A1G9KT61_9BACT|nr:IPT/TIG domain-containing protein [Catalinimonas alkaloidigena]SDL53020.1 IPT/TIG domain-containing protein [Catalinimonas alkaloidigena]
MKPRWPLYILLLAFALGCEPKEPQLFFELDTITPLAGQKGSTFVLEGSPFSAVAAENVVMFGEVRAAVTQATPTRLTVEVPTGLPFGQHEVTLSRQDVAPTTFLFRVTENPLPVVTRIVPDSGSVGTLITLYGAHLGQDADHVKVAFMEPDGSFYQSEPGASPFEPLVRSTPDSLQVRVPAHAQTGEIRLWIDAEGPTQQERFNVSTPVFQVVP